MRRQAGFIKTYNRASSPVFQQEPSEFSYFKVRPGADEEEFSPYKFQDDVQQPEMKNTLSIKKKTYGRPPLPHKLLERAQTVTNLADRTKAQFLQQKIRSKVVCFEEEKKAKKENEYRLKQENMGNIRNKMQKLDAVLRDLNEKGSENQQRKKTYQKMSKKFQQDEWTSSSSEEQDEQVVINAIPQQQFSREELQEASRQPQKRGFQEEEQEDQEEEKGDVFQREQEHISGRFSSTNIDRSPPLHQPNVITFNSRLKDQPPIQIKKYSSSESSSLENEDEPVINPVRYQHSQGQIRNPKEKASEFHKNRGGVCFDVDVKQFTAPLPKEEKPTPIAKKKKPEDKRAQILMRRQAAKTYDRKARRMVFSPHY